MFLALSMSPAPRTMKNITIQVNSGMKAANLVSFKTQVQAKQIWQRKLRVTCSLVQAKQIWQKLSEKARQCSAVSSIIAPWSLGKPNIKICCLVWRSSPWMSLLYSFCWFPSGDNSKIHEHAVTSQKLRSTWWPHKNKKLSLPQAPLCKTIISTSLKKSGAFTATRMTKLQQEGKQGKQLAHHTKSL